MSQQVYTSGSGNWVVPSGVTSADAIVQGAGAGGYGIAVAATAGGASYFDSTSVVCATGGSIAANAGSNASGGTNTAGSAGGTGGSGFGDFTWGGGGGGGAGATGNGGNGSIGIAGAGSSAGAGGSGTPAGGAGGNNANAGATLTAGTAPGGGGASIGAGGGGGGCAKITGHTVTPTASVPYVVGAAGAGGTGFYAGADGAAGRVEINYTAASGTTYEKANSFKSDSGALTGAKVRDLVKTGILIGGLKVIEKTGAMISPAALTGAKARERLNAGSMVSAAALTGADLFTKVDSGTLTSEGKLTGARTTTAIYEKTGLLVGGLVLNDKAGTITATGVLSGSDTFTKVDSGSLISEGVLSGVRTPSSQVIVKAGTMRTGGPPVVGGWLMLTGEGQNGGGLSGSKVRQPTKAGTLISAVVLSGFDRPTYAEAGTLIAAGAPSGVADRDFVKAGAFVTAGSLAGDAVPARAEAGTLIAAGVLSGGKTREYVRAGSFVSPGALSGDARPETIETGTLISAGVMSGSKAVTGASGTEYSKTGSFRSNETLLTGSDALTVTETATFAAPGALSGDAGVTFTKTGIMRALVVFNGASALALGGEASGQMTSAGRLSGARVVEFDESGHTTSAGRLAGRRAAALVLTPQLRVRDRALGQVTVTDHVASENQ